MTDTPKDKDNIVDFSKAKKGKDSSGSGTGDEGSTKNLYYAVQPVIMVEEGERLIRLKYMTESGYLDILGVLNQIQLHNKKRHRMAINLAVLGLLTGLTAIGLVIFSLS